MIRHRLLAWLSVFLVALVLLCGVPGVANAATLYEYYNTGDDSNCTAWSNLWTAQTFTPSQDHTIVKVRLLLYRYNYPGTITVGIRATGGGLPTGGDLCLGTTNGNTLPSGSPYEWREITLGEGYDLVASTKYAIVIRAPSGSSENYLKLRVDTSSPTYAGGNVCFSGNSGASWTGEPTYDYDLMFEEWGTVVVLPEVAVSPASEVARTTAQLNGTLSDDGGEVCQIRWGYGTSSVADPDDFDDPENGYDVITGWSGAYTSGQHPFYSAGDLGPDPTTYYYRIQAQNAAGITTSASEEDFTTTTGVGDPTNLNAIPSSTSISLAWIRGSDTTESILRYRMDTYPTSYTDGQLVYEGTSSSCNHTGLTPGTTYYYGVWGRSGDYYSSGSSQVLNTTTGAPEGGGSLEGPVEPSGWLSAVSYTNLANLPLVYDAVNNTADALEMPRGNFWMVLWIGGSVVIGFGFYRLTKGSALAGLLALTVLLAFGWAAIKLPMWMPVFTLLFCIGAFLFRKRETPG